MIKQIPQVKAFHITFVVDMQNKKIGKHYFKYNVPAVFLQECKFLNLLPEIFYLFESDKKSIEKTKNLQNSF